MKNIIIALSTVFLAASISFAGNVPAKKSSQCPDRPGCICSNSKPAVKKQMKAKKKKNCPNRPGCICN